MEIPIGATVGGYVLKHQLGSGGMGAVYLARHRTLPRDVALKVLHPAFVAIPQFRQRFEREADVLCRLEHPNVVDVLDKGNDGDLLWIAMRYIDGPDLATALAQRGPFPPEGAVELVAAVGSALDHAHRRNMLHRDVKPANIILRRDAEGAEHAMLTDFGIAKDLTASAPLTTEGQPPATVAYASPEQISGHPLDGRADVYSLGAVLFELLTGRRAFPHDDLAPLLASVLAGPIPDLRSVRPDIPSALGEVITRSLQKNPEQRFGTCGELVQAARIALAPRPRTPTPATIPGVHGVPAPALPAEPTQEWRGLQIVGAATALLVAVAGVVTAVVLGGTGDDPGSGGAPGSSAALDDTAEVQEDVEFEEGTTMAELAEAGTMTIGTKFDQPGFGWLDPSTQAPEGFDVEIAEMVAAQLGISPEEIEWVETVSADREPFLQAGQADMVVATYTITDARKEVVDFAGPYYEAGQDILVRAGNPQGIEGPEDLAGLSVCSVAGSTPAQNIRDTYPEARLTLLDTYSECADELSSGEVDAVTTDNVILIGFVAVSDGEFELVGNRFTDEPYGIGVPKGDDEFRAFINDVLEQSVEDGSWAEAWDRTIGAITGEETPEPPAVDRY